MEDKITFPNWQSRWLVGPLIKRQSIVPDPPPAALRFLLRLYERAVLRPDLAGIDIEKPIFLVGLPRSGTTVLQDLLCSHPDVAYLTNTMHQFRDCMCGAEHMRKLLRLDARAERYLADGIEVSPGSASEAIGFWAAWFRLDLFSLDFVERHPADLTAGDIAAMQRAMREAVWCFGGGQRRFFSKVFGLLWNLPTLRHIFPEARFLHIVRDARSTANSMLKLYRLELEQQARLGQTGRQPFVPYPRVPRLPEYIRDYGLSDIRTTARIWDDIITRIRETSGQLSHYMEIRYEDFVGNPAAIARRVLDFCALPPVDGADHPYARKLAGIRQGKPYVDDGTFAVVEEVCRDNMRRYGYLAPKA